MTATGFGGFAMEEEETDAHVRKWFDDPDMSLSQFGAQPPASDSFAPLPTDSFASPEAVPTHAPVLALEPSTSSTAHVRAAAVHHRPTPQERTSAPEQVAVPERPPAALLPPPPERSTIMDQNRRRAAMATAVHPADPGRRKPPPPQVSSAASAPVSAPQPSQVMSGRGFWERSEKLLLSMYQQQTERERKIDQLTKEKYELEDRALKYRAQVETTLAERDQLDRQLKKTLQDLEIQQKLCDDVAQAEKDLREQVDRVKEDCARIDQYRELFEKKTEAQDEVLKKQASHFRASIESLAEKLDKMSETAGDLRDKLETSESVIAQHVRDLEEARKEKEDLESQLAAAKEQITQNLRDKDEAEKLEQTITALREALAAAQETIAEKDCDMEKASVRFAEFIDDLKAKCSNETRAMQTEFEAKMSALKLEKERQAEQLKFEAEQMKREVKALAEKDLAEKEQAFEMQMKAMQEEAKNLGAMKDQEIDKVWKDMARMKEEAKIMAEHDKEAIEKAFQIKQTQVEEEFKTLTAKKEEEVKQALKNLAELKEEAKILAEKNKEAEQTAEALQTQKGTIEEKMNRLQEELEASEKRLAEKVGELEEARKKNDALGLENSQLKQDLAKKGNGQGTPILSRSPPAKRQGVGRKALTFPDDDDTEEEEEEKPKRHKLAPVKKALPDRKMPAERKTPVKKAEKKPEDLYRNYNDASAGDVAPRRKLPVQAASRNTSHSKSRSVEESDVEWF